MAYRIDSTKNRGFTLLELLIVIAIIAILSAVLIFILNPAETLKKSRDTRRIADLQTIHKALGLLITLNQSAVLCQTSPTDRFLPHNFSSYIRIHYSWRGGGIVDVNWPQNISSVSCGDNQPAGYTYWANIGSASVSQLHSITGNGWIPVNFTVLTDGSPISSLPIDPVNDIVQRGDVLNCPDNSISITKPDFIYRYACKDSSKTWELNARLESTSYFNGGSRDKTTTDGGNNPVLFEVGNDLTILPDEDILAEDGSNSWW